MALRRWSGRQWSDVGIGALTLIAAVVVVMALLQYRPLAAPVASATPTASPTATSATPTASPTATSATPTPTITMLARATASLTSPEGASVLVFGDGSGNENDEWVAVWARDHLGVAAKVSYRAWDPARGRYAAATLHGASGPSIDVWNASVASPDMAQEPARIAKAWQKADLVMLSYGHQRSPESVTAQLDAVLAAIRGQAADVPIVVMIQNPDRVTSETTQRATTQKVQAWAVAQGFATVDIYSAFIADPKPRNDLVERDGSPTPRGSLLWARTLADAVKGA